MSGLTEDLLRIGTGIGQHLVRLGFGGVCKPVGGVLGQTQHSRRLQGLFLVHPRRDRRRRRLARFGLIRRDCLGGLRRNAGTAARGELLIQLVDPLTQIGVLFDQAGQLVFHQVEEGVDLIFVVPTFADRRLTDATLWTSAGVSGIVCPLEFLDGQTIWKCRTEW